MSIDISVVTSTSQCLPGHLRFVAEFTAPSSPHAEAPPMCIAVALDVSGSMNGEPLKHALHSVRFLAKRLRAQDRLALVTFSSDACVMLPLMGAGSRTVIESVLRSVGASGGTNIEAGLVVAAEALKGATDGERCLLLLLTDGEATCGNTSEEGLGRIARKYRDRMTICTLGYGENHDERVLASIAECGGGKYAFIPDSEVCTLEIARVLGAQSDVVVDGIEVVIEGGLVELHAGGDVMAPGRVGLPALRAGKSHTIAGVMAVAGNSPSLIARYRHSGVTTEKRVALPPCATGGDEILPRFYRAAAAGLRRRVESLAALGEHAEAMTRVRAFLVEAGPHSGGDALLAELLEQLRDDLVVLEEKPDAARFQEYQRFNMGDVDADGGAERALVEGAAGQVPDACVTVLDGGVKRVPLKADNVLGRTGQADIALPSNSVSRRHTRIYALHGAFWVRDLGSTNGTSVNGVRVKNQRLRNGDRIHVGQVELIFEEGRGGPRDAR